MPDKVENTTRKWTVSTGDVLPDYLLNNLRSTPVEEITFENRILTITLQSGQTIMFRVRSDEKLLVEY